MVACLGTLRQLLVACRPSDLTIQTYFVAVCLPFVIPISNATAFLAFRFAYLELELLVDELLIRSLLCGVVQRQHDRRTCLRH